MIRELVERYGYPALFLLVALESLGVPLPGEAALLGAGAFAAAGHRLSLIGVIAVAALGAIIGDAAGYWIGRTGGLTLVRRYGRYLHLDERRLDRARAFFDRHGGKAVFLGRFVSLLRMWAAVLAGVARMPYARFALYNVAGGICWATLVGWLGYAFGANLPRLQKAVGHAGALAALLVALAVALTLAGRQVIAQREAIWAWLTGQLRRVAASAPVRRLQMQYPGLWAFVGRRFAAEYLGLHLTLGLALSLAALWLFGGIAEDVIHHDPLTSFDISLAAVLYRHATSFGVMVARAISFLGSPMFIGGWSIVVVAYLLRRAERMLALVFVLALGGGALLDVALKGVFHRPRPVWDVPLSSAYGWSFPSGHAMGSLVAYGMLTYVILRLAHWRHARMIAAAAVGLVLLIGLSRMYLGVHYFSDVVGGYAAGAVWLSTCISALEMMRRRPRLAEASA